MQEILVNFVAFSIVLMIFLEYFKIRKIIFLKFKNMTNVYTFKTKVTTKRNAKKNSLSRRARKEPNLKKVGILMFKLVINSKKNTQNKNFQFVTTL